MVVAGKNTGFFSIFSSTFLPLGNFNGQKGSELHPSSSYNDTVLFISTVFGILMIILMLAIIVYLRNDQIRKENKESNEGIISTDEVQPEFLGENEEANNLNGRIQRNGIRNRNNNRNRNNHHRNQRFLFNRLRGRGRLHLVENEENNDHANEEQIENNDMHENFDHVNEQVFLENEDENLLIEGNINNDDSSNLTRAERRAKRRKERKEERIRLLKCRKKDI